PAGCRTECRGAGRTGRGTAPRGSYPPSHAQRPPVRPAAPASFCKTPGTPRPAPGDNRFLRWVPVLPPWGNPHPAQGTAQCRGPPAPQTPGPDPLPAGYTGLYGPKVRSKTEGLQWFSCLSIYLCKIPQIYDF